MNFYLTLEINIFALTILPAQTFKNFFGEHYITMKSTRKKICETDVSFSGKLLYSQREDGLLVEMKLLFAIF